MSETPGSPAPASDLGALRRLWLLGAGMLLLTLGGPFAFRLGGDHAFMGIAVATGLIAFAATRTAGQAPTRAALWTIAAVAVAARGYLLLTEPLLSTDIYRYVWDGRVQAAGINPYRYVPADPALAALRDAAIFPNINRADYAVTIYPPVAQMFFFLVTRLGESVTVMKLALLACEAATAAIVVLLLRRIGRAPTRIVAYAWHPLPLWEIANNGHIDALMIALMVAGLWLALGGRGLKGAAAITLGALAKPFALLALPAVWRPWDWRAPALVSLVIALCYAPYLSVGSGVLGFLGTAYVYEEHLDTGGDVWLLAAWRLVAGRLAWDYPVYLAAAGLALAALALRTARDWQQPVAARLRQINWLLLAFLTLLSLNYPWYFLILTPFVALVGGAPVWVLSVGAVLLQQEATWDWRAPVLAYKTILYGAVIAACAWQIRQARAGAGR